ncbi:succinate dehydrogenase assembly factor 2, mitochondrial [Cryptotermes secundus]|uniref:succinate dehydrogenase assembly factor 2, mitochondrial n=1 Tax=Cryptotermes secundus TaxID=105785 RepID=UPI000CD7C870|nr:succinate dehydrogenase assembly factor 2, mitochondrial [Cryptotermes secundus]
MFQMALKELKLYHISRNMMYPRSPFIQPFKVGTANVATQEGPPQEFSEPQIPPYRERTDEPLQLKRARLLYQSRKRGMLENDLLLASFAAKYLQSMTAEQVKLYDRLINLPSNDWDIFHWATGVKPTPAEFDNEIMHLLKEHVQNKDRECRVLQPNLYT